MNKDDPNELLALREKCSMYESWLRALDEHGEFDLWFKDKDSQYRFINNHFANTMGRAKHGLIDVRPKTCSVLIVQTACVRWTKQPRLSCFDLATNLSGV